MPFNTTAGNEERVKGANPEHWSGKRGLRKLNMQIVETRGRTVDGEILLYLYSNG